MGCGWFQLCVTISIAWQTSIRIGLSSQLVYIDLSNKVVIQKKIFKVRTKQLEFSTSVKWVYHPRFLQPRTCALTQTKTNTGSVFVVSILWRNLNGLGVERFDV